MHKWDGLRLELLETPDLTEGMARDAVHKVLCAGQRLYPPRSGEYRRIADGSMHAELFEA